MKKLLARVVVVVFLAALSALTAVPLRAQHHQEHSAQGIAGTWDMTLQSHQLALVLKQEGKKVSATLMMPGKDVPLEGEYADGALTLATPAGDSGAMQMKLTGKLQADGTLAGEFEGSRGKANWTAERLKKRG